MRKHPTTILVLSMLAVAGCVGAAPKDLEATLDDADAVVAGAGSADSSRRPTYLGEIAPGATVEGAFGRDARYLAWGFSASAGARARLFARGAHDPDLDTVLVVYRAREDGVPYGRRLAANDDHYADGELQWSSLVEHTFAEAGFYVALVHRYDGRGTGVVALSLELEGDGGGPRVCGSSFHLPACGPNEFCAYPPEAACGRDGRSGTCARIPEACPAIVAPVCGCDGRTYNSFCIASAQGVSVEHDGACEARACGSRGLPACAVGEFCSYPAEAACGRADHPGTCERIPEACPAVVAPVCGCDGRTYDNFCVANAQGVSVEHEGACPRPCGGVFRTPCSEGEYCHFESGLCGAGGETGMCRPIPTVCTREFMPVCGCDGRTYSNACNAAAAGVSVARSGACDAPADCRTAGCPSGRYCTFCWGRFACIPDGAVC